ncbi:MAG: hypothetical protein QM734_15275 [Cyclobacteriaceae bacterium]
MEIGIAHFMLTRLIPSGYASWMMPAFQYEASIKSIANLKLYEQKYLDVINRLKAKLENIQKLAK